MIIGHQKQITKLRSLIKKNDIPHTILFTGPESVGKKAIAKWFLKTINCLKGKNKPCDSCVSCNEINDDVHCDVLTISPVEGKIDMEQIEALRKRVSYRALKANYKGVIIDDAHLMNLYAQNAALKTLEEPTVNTVIFLITEYPHLLFNTILSRCFQLKFSLVLEKDILNVIDNKDAVQLAMGKPGKAIIYSKDKEQIKKAKESKKRAESIIKGSFAYQSKELKKMIKDEGAEDVSDLLNYFLYIKRNVMIDKIKKQKSVDIDIDMVKRLEEAIFFKTKTNANLQLIIERALI